MKTENTRYQNPTLEATQKSSCDEINEHAKHDAERTGAKNLPHVLGDHMSSYIEGPHLSHQGEIDKVDAELQIQITLAEVSEKQEATEHQTRDLQNKMANARGKDVQIESKRKNTSFPAYLKQLIFAELGIGITCSFDGVMSINIWGTWGFSLIESIFMGALFAGVLTMFAQTFLRLINLGKTIWKRRLIALGLSTLLITLFIYMAISRAEYLSAAMNANAINIHFSPLPFIFTSILLFIIAVAIHYFYMPTVEQAEAIREYLRLRKEKRAINAEIARIDAAITIVQQENSDLRSLNASILVFGATSEKRIINNAYTCYALWKKHNLMHRPDNRKPDCFDEPYPFTFKTNFLLNNNSREKDI